MARFVSESVQSHERILIVNNGLPEIASQLKSLFERYGAAIQITPVLPPHHHRFHRIFLLNTEPKHADNLNPRSHVAQILLLPYNKQPPTQKKHIGIRRICVSQDSIHEDALNQALWYAFSDDSTPYLDLRTRVFRRPEPETPQRTRRQVSLRTTASGWIVASLIVMLLGFLIPLIWATQINVRLLSQTAQDGKLRQESEELLAKRLTTAAQTLYIPARPFYSLFSISLTTDNSLRFNVAAHRYFELRRQISREGQMIVSWLQNPQQQTRTELLSKLGSLSESYLQLSKVLDDITTTVPQNTQTKSLQGTIQHEGVIAKKIVQAVPLLQGFLGLDGSQSVLLIVTDSNRLRGVGGTVQAVGLLNRSSQGGWSSRFYSAKELLGPTDLERISSVLTTYAPADATALHDSSLSVDLYDLKEKLVAQIPRVSGGRKPTITVLLTTPGIQTLLASFPEVTIQGEIFNSANFAIKQQLYAQQAVLYPLLFGQLYDTLGTVSIEKLLNNLITVFDEKQGAIVTADQGLQTQLDQLYWSGKTISPTCVNAQSACINDYLFSIDQDLSNRTTSSYVQKAVKKTARLSDQRDIASTVELTWHNGSPLPEESGGVYRVYTQLLLPGNAQILRITKNDAELESYDSLKGKFLILGLYHEVAPGRSSTISVSYRIPKKLRERTQYQLVVQKQLGSPTLPLSLKLSFPSHYAVSTTNIDQVVNNSAITYNTILNTDKLFFVETAKR